MHHSAAGEVDRMNSRVLVPDAVICVWRGIHAIEKSPFQVSKKLAATMESETVPTQPPKDRDEAGDAEALRQYREDILSPDQPAIEQRQSRQRHEQHERGRHHLEPVVTGAG